MLWFSHAVPLCPLPPPLPLAPKHPFEREQRGPPPEPAPHSPLWGPPSHGGPPSCESLHPSSGRAPRGVGREPLGGGEGRAPRGGPMCVRGESPAGGEGGERGEPLGGAPHSPQGIGTPRERGPRTRGPPGPVSTSPRGRPPISRTLGITHAAPSRRCPRSLPGSSPLSAAPAPRGLGDPGNRTPPPPLRFRPPHLSAM